MKRLLLIYSGLTWDDPAIAGTCVALKKSGIEVQVLALNSTPNSNFEKRLHASGIPVHHRYLSGKPSIPMATLGTILLLLKLRPHVVHTHLLEANLIGLFSAWLLRIPKRIHTRHHADYNHRFLRKALIWDRISNWLSTQVIATSLNVKRVLLELDRVPPEKVVLVYHGIDVPRFTEVSPDLVQALRKKYRIPDCHPVVGIFSRYVVWKGWEYSLPALAELRRRIPDAFFVFANSFPTAYRRETLAPLFQGLPPESYVEIESETEVQALYRCLDIFVHTPTDPTSEAYGLVYVEAMLAERPMIVTLSGIANEFVKNGENATVIPYRDSMALAIAVETLWRDPVKAKQLAKQARHDAESRFSSERMVRSLTEVYS